MLKWLFGGGAARADRGDEHVWVTSPARLTGVIRSVDDLVRAGRAVVVVALTPASLQTLSLALESHRPVVCADLFGRAPLDVSLVKPGSVAIALASALTGDSRPASPVPVEIVVVGRHDTPEGDAAIERFADALGSSARLTFHSSLDDPLLADLGPRIPELLGRLGMKDDEPITHALVGKAIRRAQEQRARRVEA